MDDSFDMHNIPHSNSMTAISDIPITEITGNKRHTLYNNTQPPQLAVVTAPPSKDLPSNVPKYQPKPLVSEPETYKVQSVTKKTSKSNEAKGTMYALLSETTLASKKNSYSEKVALFTKEATFSQPGGAGQSSLEEQQPIEDKTPVEPPTSTTAMISVDDTDEDLVQGEVVSSQIITSRYEVIFFFYFTVLFIKRKIMMYCRSRTVETTTYSCEHEGETETKVEQKVTIQSDGEPIDHDEALAQAIQEATAMNPDMTVEKIEIHQTTQNNAAASTDTN